MGIKKPTACAIMVYDTLFLPSLWTAPATPNAKLIAQYIDVIKTNITFFALSVALVWFAVCELVSAGWQSCRHF